MRKYEKNYPDISGYLKKSLHNELTLLGFDHIDVKFLGIDYTYVGTNDQIEGNPKGKAIIDALRNLQHTPDIVMVCDGSGKIPFTNIPRIFEELLSDSSLAAVMINRVGNKWISQYRNLIERFEVFSLKKVHLHIKDIPDGQGGLWAYRYGKLNCDGKEDEIKLTAEGYEVELDLLNEVLSKDLRYSFVNVEMPKPKEEIPTSYSRDDSRKKLGFLCSKCLKFKDYLLECLTEYERSKEFISISSESSEEDIKKWNEEYTTDVKALAETKGS